MQPLTGDPSALIDLERFPIQHLHEPASITFADQCRSEFELNGLCALPGFIKQSAMQRLVDETRSLIPDAYFCDSTHDAYLNEGSDKPTKNEAEHRQEKTFVGSIPYDKIQTDMALKQLYLWDPLMHFIGYVLNKPALYRFADPFGACSVNVFVDGGQHGWHFDESEFTVTLMLQAPEQGGSFEYVPGIRGLPNENELVSQALEGTSAGIKELPFTAGTLLIFGGRQTLHRVTKIAGEQARLVPVLCYAETPDLTNSPPVQQLFWGRTATA